MSPLSQLERGVLPSPLSEFVCTVKLARMYFRLIYYQFYQACPFLDNFFFFKGSLPFLVCFLRVRCNLFLSQLIIKFWHLFLFAKSQHNFRSRKQSKRNIARDGIQVPLSYTILFNHIIQLRSSINSCNFATFFSRKRVIITQYFLFVKKCFRLKQKYSFHCFSFSRTKRKKN